jgi:hypothetical protein
MAFHLMISLEQLRFIFVFYLMLVRVGLVSSGMDEKL